MFKRFLLCTVLLAAALRASAFDFTDIYFVPAEQGYGFNVVQNDNFLFVTFFIYGPNNQPTWYTAQLVGDQTGINFSGPLYATTGTYYGLPWNPSDHPPATQVGTASFQAISLYTANFTYTVTTPPALAATVTKVIQRQTLVAFNIAGAYAGGQAGLYSGCPNSANNLSYTDHFNLQVTQSPDGSAFGSVTFQFTYLDNGTQLKCTLTGRLLQIGQLYTVPSATYSCSNGLSTNASMGAIKQTSLGIEGGFSAPVSLAGCREDANFGGPAH